jgi:hypothetical protein
MRQRSQEIDDNLEAAFSIPILKATGFIILNKIMREFLRIRGNELVAYR